MEEIISIDYENVLNMLNSPDKENGIVALTGLENVQLEPNIVSILLLRKESKSDAHLWKMHAPNLCLAIKERGIDISSFIAFSDITNLIATLKVREEEIHRLVCRINEHLRHELRKVGYAYIKTINVTLEHE